MPGREFFAQRPQAGLQGEPRASQLGDLRGQLGRFLGRQPASGKDRRKRVVRHGHGSCEYPAHSVCRSISDGTRSVPDTVNLFRKSPQNGNVRAQHAQGVKRRDLPATTIVKITAGEPARARPRYSARGDRRRRRSATSQPTTASLRHLDAAIAAKAAGRRRQSWSRRPDRFAPFQSGGQRPARLHRRRIAGRLARQWDRWCRRTRCSSSIASSRKKVGTRPAEHGPEPRQARARRRPGSRRASSPARSPHPGMLPHDDQNGWPVPRGWPNRHEAMVEITATPRREEFGERCGHRACGNGKAREQPQATPAPGPDRATPGQCRGGSSPRAYGTGHRFQRRRQAARPTPLDHRSIHLRQTDFRIG